MKFVELNMDNYEYKMLIHSNELTQNIITY